MTSCNSRDYIAICFQIRSVYNLSQSPSILYLFGFLYLSKLLVWSFVAFQDSILQCKDASFCYCAHDLRITVFKPWRCSLFSFTGLTLPPTVKDRWRKRYDTLVCMKSWKKKRRTRTVSSSKRKFCNVQKRVRTDKMKLRSESVVCTAET